MANTADHYYDTEEYRDSIATVDKSGKRIWIYPKKPSGRFYNWRKIVSYIFLALFFLIPFLKINGNPVLQIDIIERKFSILGTLFFPQDFHIFLFFMLTSAVFIILFTVIFGRLFCGWVCPQTVFMELVFRRVEYFIEGDWNQQKKLNSRSWDTDKIIRKIFKHFVFLLISFIIGNTFLSYIIGYEKVLHIANDPISAHFSGLLAMIAFTLIFYGVYAFMREQVCTTICPYGRLQGVLLDKSSIAISYDFLRGEPRTKLQKETSSKEGMIELPVVGDCIDCKLCIKVCPTGIDIRNGTQLECINCTACIDVCDEVMDKIGKPKGLIRYDSANGITTGNKKWFTPRAKAYSALLIILCIINTVMFLTRKDVEATILHTPGTTYQKENGNINNLFNYKLVNKTSEDIDVKLAVKELDATITLIGNETIHVQKADKASGTIIISIPEEKLKDRKTPLHIEVIWANDRETIKTNFLGPIK